MNYIVVIPARGQSKGIPKKNLAKVSGCSLIEWAAAAVPNGANAVVSTDDTAISAPGVSFLPRSPDLAQDHTPDLPVAQEIVKLLGWLQNDDVMVWLRPTSPFRSHAHVKAIIEYMDAFREVDSVRSIVHPKDHPAKCYRMVGTCSNSEIRLAPWGPDHRANHPRQFLVPAWKAAGWIDAVRVRTVLSGSMEGDIIVGWRLPWPEADRIEIDTEDDLAHANEIALSHNWKPGHCE